MFQYDVNAKYRLISGPWRPNFTLGRLENFSFLYKLYAGHLGFHRFRAMGSLQFSLAHSLAVDKTLLCYHLNENSWAALSHGSILCFRILQNMIRTFS